VATDDIDIESGQLWAAGALGIEELPIDEAHSALLATFPGPPPFGAFPDAVSVADPPQSETRAFAAPSQVGPFHIAPPWALDEDHAASLGLVALSIDPGDAFGHGAHPTTRLMLTALTALDVEGRAIADIGCGTGIVAVAAATLGASPVYAIDHDPSALAATRRNVAANDLSHAVEVIDGDATRFDYVVDIALVNVTIDAHERIAPAIAALVSESIVVGGILENQLDRAIAAYPDHVSRAHTASGEWHTLELVRARSDR
jgi:ribosomal protein L11 methyltransferase